MSEMFYYCKSLLSLPDISKWNTSNLENAYRMFGECDKIMKKPTIKRKKRGLFG